MMTADHVAALAEVLGEHADMTDRSATDGCSCGYPDPRTYERHAVEAILASPAMRDLLADVWDEGWQTCDDDGQWPNPYRADREHVNHVALSLDGAHAALTGGQMRWEPGPSDTEESA